jgi:D-alanyl-D-alanine carboxypeptidase
VSALGIPADYGTRRGLALQPEARELVSVGRTPEGRDVHLSPGAAMDWLRMRDAASQSGIALVALSGFRSVERQTALIEAKLSTGQAIGDILRTVAAPGYSEHHTGRAVDIAVPERLTLTEAFAETPAFAWLTLNAHQFGFRMSYPRGNPHGMAFEPWHWLHQGQ